MREKRNLVHRNVDATAVPGGPQGQFARQYVAQIDAIRAPLNELLARVESLETAEPATTSGGSASRYPRKKITNGSGDPYVIPWTEEGYAYDDVGATADVYLTLPDPAGFEGDLNEISPVFLFHRTASYEMVIVAQGGAVIHVDLTDQSAANGNVALREANSCVALRLIDNGWRAFHVQGRWTIDYSP